MIGASLTTRPSASLSSSDAKVLLLDAKHHTSSADTSTLTQSTSSSWFNPVTTIQSLVNYSVFMVVVSQLICPVLLPLILSSFLDARDASSSSSSNDHFIVSFSVGFENEKRLITNLNLSATKLIFMLQWLIHVPLVVLPYISLIVNKSYVRESRMIVYWFCILSLFLSNVIVSLKQASYDWISFIPNVLESADISWGGEKLVFDRSVPLIKKQLETSSILPQLLSILLFITITLYFIRDVIFGLNVNFRGQDEIVGFREFVTREFSTCLVYPIQAMLKLTSIDSNLEDLNDNRKSQPSIVSKKEFNQNVPSNKDIQSPSSPTDVNVTPSVETGESPRLALSITNSKPMLTLSEKLKTKPQIESDEDETGWGDDEDENDDDETSNKFAKALLGKKEKMVASKSENNHESNDSQSPSSDLPSVSIPSVSMVITGAAQNITPTESVSDHGASKISPTLKTAPKLMGAKFLNKRYSGRTPIDETHKEINLELESVANKNRNSKSLSEPIEEEEVHEEKPSVEKKKRVVSFDD